MPTVCVRIFSSGNKNEYSPSMLQMHQAHDVYMHHSLIDCDEEDKNNNFLLLIIIEVPDKVVRFWIYYNYFPIHLYELNIFVNIMEMRS
jgi:hypothetical protein